MVQLFARAELHAVAGCPTIKLRLSPPAEPQQLRPELFDEVYQPRDTGFLCFVSTAERHARNMNVQPTGACAVAAVAEMFGLVQDILPRHFAQVVLERHRVSDKLQSIVQTAVRLDVQVLGVAVGNVEKTVGVRGAFSALVDLEFDAKLAQPFAVKYEVGRVVVVVHRTAVAVVIVAIAAQRFAAKLVNIVVRNEHAAVLTARVIAISAGMAEDVGVVAFVIVAVDTRATFVAEDSQISCAVWAEQVVPDAEHLIERIGVAAVGTYMGGLHFQSSLF